MAQSNTQKILNSESPKLLCYAIDENPPVLRPARFEREWMDEFPSRHAYRCLPLSIANTYGWEILCPFKLEIEWMGGPAISDIIIRCRDRCMAQVPLEHVCRSNFSRGIATFHTGYLFRTSPGWDLVATGPFNSPKDGISPLTGIVESDWLPYPFTMNWQMTRKGSVIFEKDEPFCLLFPIPRHALVNCVPEIVRLSDDEVLDADHAAFRLERDRFMERFHAGDTNTIRQGWLRHYFQGKLPDGRRIPDHVNKLRLHDPVDRRTANSMSSAMTVSDPMRMSSESCVARDTEETAVPIQYDQPNSEKPMPRGLATMRRFDLSAIKPAQAAPRKALSIFPMNRFNSRASGARKSSPRQPWRKEKEILQ